MQASPRPVISDPLVRDTTAGMSAGALAGAASYAPDVIKTRMQLDTKGIYPTARATFKKMVQEEGARSLLNPLPMAARALTIGPLIGLTAVFKERVPHALPKSCHESAPMRS